MKEKGEARRLRARVENACSLFLSEKKALFENGEKLEWADFELLPEWCLWESKRLHHLAATVGTVFLLPSIRLWIKSKEIQEVQSLIGKDLYEFLIEFTYKEIEPSKHAHIEDVEKTLKTTGSAVILSSLEKKYEPWLLPKLPKPNGKLKRKLAGELINHALYAIKESENMAGFNKVEEEQVR